MRGKGAYWEIPVESYPPLDQGAVILKQSKHQDAARRFLEFLKGSQGQEIMRRYGFILPG